MPTNHSTNCKHRLLVAAIPVLAFALPAAAQNICTYNNASTSFGATYSNNQESSATAVACTAGSPTTAGRLNDTSYARSVITAPNTGDFKFLVKSATANNTPPTFMMVSSQSPETRQFPDSTIAAPSGGGCDDGPLSPGINAIERHLHSSWPLFGQTYYYGDYVALNQPDNIPADPKTVTSPTSPYLKWTPYNPPDEYRYLDSDNSHGWGPHNNGVTADRMHPLMDPGLAVGCSARGLVGADYLTCRSCMASKGYYLKDGAVAGDLMQSVFKGSILNVSSGYDPRRGH
jgi:hypothetical protein